MIDKLANPLIVNEIVIGNKDNSYKIARLIKEGLLRKLAPKIYTSNLGDTPERIILRNHLNIIKAFFPGAIISHRSALEARPTSDHYFFISYRNATHLKLSGLTIVALKSDMNIEGTNSFMGDLFISNRERAFLENLQQTKTSTISNKSVSQKEIEKKLDQICQIHGEEALNQIRDVARTLSVELSMEPEFRKLNKIISAILNTHPSSVLLTSEARARHLNMSYDPVRIERFDVLFKYLQENEFKSLLKTFVTPKEFENQCFYEAYFSNYIEGTRFEISEAVEIIFEGKLPESRPDAHDILGTYQLLTNKTLMGIKIKDPAHFIELIKHHHKILLSAHPHAHPGEFKEKRNQAGNTLFVEPSAVIGTLVKGLENYYLLQDPLKQSIYLMFLIAEVHPFNDGNGRIARLFMNSILFSHNLEKIIVPNVFRDDYLGSLKKLTMKNDPVPFVRTMIRCLEFSSKIDYSTFENATRDLKLSNAFLEPSEGKLIVI
ncbi:MAG: Fic family protein [Bacteriovorax sp.]|nr:Fic family protein [Bacteriovorax sp.]